MAEGRQKQGVVQANIAGAQDLEPFPAAQGAHPQVCTHTLSPGPGSVTTSHYLLARGLVGVGEGGSPAHTLSFSNGSRSKPVDGRAVWATLLVRTELRH